MDQIKKRLSNKQFMKKTLKFVFSISAFSFFLCYYSSSFFIYPQTFNAYFCTCLFAFFTHTLERKYMFLICNGILAFLAKNLLFIPTTSSEAHFDQLHASDDMIVAPFASYQSLEEVSLIDEDQEDEYYEEKVLEDEEHKEYTLNETCIEKEKEVNVLAQDDDDNEEVEAGTALTRNEELVNTEELNRKFEEFIRKMKEEMRIEAQTHLIAV
ncbi:unnamed protein product [Trifolium pratense]|uniref:Uncharacterized protein n=1 Tax=Trifolium pratense TaxID=57577 RepID=A0ACB0KLU2_TRIPR|nr:unnamed protein product [Trifolium pratense]